MEPKREPQSEAQAYRPWNGLLAAIQFLMVSPAFIRRPFTATELGRSVGYYPVVGMLVAAALLAADWVLARVFPQALVSGLLLAIWIALSGAFHLDGFLDTCDGLLGGFTPESRLEIMRDERIGAFAFAGGALLLLLKFSALASLEARAAGLILAPVLGRWAISLAIVVFPYARKQGLGREIKNAARNEEALQATLLAGAAALAAAAWIGLAAMVVAGIIMWLFARYALKRLPGLTGDIYGATNEIVELAVLLTVVAVQHNALL